MIGINGELIAFLQLISIVLIICCLFWLAVSIRKKYTVGKILSIVIILFLSYPFLESYYKTYALRNNVKKDLNILKFQLNDNFEIPLSYGSDSFLGKNQTTKIAITAEDKSKLINQIVNSKNFKVINTEKKILLENEKTYLSQYFLNYKYPEYYSRKVKTKIENKQITIDLHVDIIENVIEYHKWEK
jgi:predicted nucleic-acid-binding Zn-ribbon protein